MSRAGERRRWRLVGLVAGAAVGVMSSSAGAQGSSGRALEPAQLVATLHQVNQMEITAGQMAQQNGSMPAVRDLGQMLVRDHQTADDQLTTYAKSKGFSLSDTPMNVRKHQQALQAKMERMQKMTGPSFDHAFAVAMDKAHGQVIAMIDASRTTVRDEGLVVLLDRLEPTLRKHQQMAENILNGKTSPPAGHTNLVPTRDRASIRALARG
jgi:putative membrane protein